MSSAVGLNLLAAPITTTTNVVSSPIPSQNENSNDASNNEINDIKHDKNLSNCHQKRYSTEESDTNHNAEPIEGMLNIHNTIDYLNLLK